MKTIRVILIIYIAMIDFLSGEDVYAQSIQLSHIERIIGFPSAEPGIEKGVSACFAGTVGNTLLMAGGCNFPNRPAAEGVKNAFIKASMLHRLPIIMNFIGDASDSFLLLVPMV